MRALTSKLRDVPSSTEEKPTSRGSLVKSTDTPASDEVAWLLPLLARPHQRVCSMSMRPEAVACGPRNYRARELGRAGGGARYLDIDAPLGLSEAVASTGGVCSLKISSTASA